MKDFTAIASPSFETEGGAPAAPSAPAAPAAPSAPSGGQPSAPAPSAPGGTLAAAPAAPTPAPPTTFAYKEDRSNWIPPHVNRKYVDQAEQYKRDLYVAQQRVAALSGVQPPAAPRNPEHDAIRQQFREVFPEMAALMDKAEQLQKLAGVDLDRITSSADAVWTSRGTQTLQTFEEKVKAAYGGADLSPKAIQRITYAFVNEVSSDPELQARYEAGDMRIIDEFIKDYTSGVLDPYRKTTAAAQAPNPAARRLPRGGGGSAISAPRPATLKPGDPDYHKAAFARFQQG